MSIDEKDNLKLIGKNQENLKVISAYLQDSVVIVRDIVFLKKNRTFIMIVNRFNFFCPLRNNIILSFDYSNSHFLQ